MSAKKSLLKNSLFNVAYRALNVLFPLISATYVSRVLLAEGVGKVSFAQTIVAYFTTIAGLGIPNYGVKMIASSMESRDNRSRVFSELFIINTISTLVCSLAYYTMVTEVAYFSNEKLLYYCVGLSLILNIFNVDWFYQGCEEYAYITIRSSLIKVVSIIGIFLFVKTKADYTVYALISCLAIAGNYIFNIVNLRHYIGFTLKNVEITRHLKPVFILLASSIATEIYTMLDSTMVGFFHGNTAVGYYTNSVKIVRLTYTLVAAIFATFFPRMSYYYSTGEMSKFDVLINRGFQIFAFIAVPSSIGMFAVADYLIPVLFGSSFYGAIETTRILSVLIIVFSVAMLLGHQLLMAVGKEKCILRATITGAICNFGLNMLLIPSLKQNGAAIASVCAEIVVTTIMIANAKENIRLKISKRFACAEVFSILLMCMSILALRIFLKGWGVPSATKLVIIIAGAIIAYLGGNLIIKNELLMAVISFVSGKLQKK